MQQIPTKLRRTFEQRIANFNEDLELLDVLRISVLKEDSETQIWLKLLENVDKKKHSHIEKNFHNRKELIINHFRKTVYSSYVKDLYEEVYDYLKSILKIVSLTDFGKTSSLVDIMHQ